MAQQNLKNMHLGELKKRAQKSGVTGVEQKNKTELLQAMGAGPAASSRPGRGGGRGDAPQPKGTKPSQWKNVPGNQS